MKTRIYPLALGKILRHSLTNVNREVIGLLVGRLQGQYLEIWDAVTGGQKGNPGFVELQGEVQASVAERLRDEINDLCIVGWYHSHPGMGLFLSGIDIDTQKHYQSLYPKAVALVIDPLPYSRTKRVSDVKFRVFRIGRGGRIFQSTVHVGVQRPKVLESTLYALDTLDIRHLVDVDVEPTALRTQKSTLDVMSEPQREYAAEPPEEIKVLEYVDDPAGLGERREQIPRTFSEYMKMKVKSAKGVMAMIIAAVAIMVILMLMNRFL